MYEQVLDNFIGRTVVEINDMIPILIFEKGLLTVECSWRVRDDKFILVGCSEYNHEKTHLDSYKNLSNTLLGKNIIKITYIPPVSDLIIQFNNGTILELFSDSNIFESWTLDDGDKTLLISATAGEGVFFD